MNRRKKIGYYTKIDPALREAMRRYKADVGVPEAVQIDRALRAWLTERGVMKAERKRAGSHPPKLP